MNIGLSEFFWLICHILVNIIRNRLNSTKIFSCVSTYFIYKKSKISLRHFWRDISINRSITRNTCDLSFKVNIRAWLLLSYFYTYTLIILHQRLLIWLLNQRILFFINRHGFDGVIIYCLSENINSHVSHLVRLSWCRSHCFRNCWFFWANFWFNWRLNPPGHQATFILVWVL